MIESGTNLAVDALRGNNLRDGINREANAFKQRGAERIDYFNRAKVNDINSKSYIYIHILNSIENQKSIHQFMYIEDVNYSSQMLYFSQIRIW